MSGLLGTAAALASGLALAAVWRALGAGDAPDGAEAERKLQQAPVPAVGGLALALGALALGLSGELDGVLTGGWGLVAATGALALGTLDDLRPGGLGPAVKLALQSLVGLALAAAWEPSTGLPSAALAGLGAVAAMNALNTFDNADGASLGAAGSGLLAGGSALAPAVLVLLLPNLLLRRRRTGPGPGDPLLYLGDAGSHLLAVLVVATPGAAWALLLPVLDLAWVSVRRLRLGLPPWRGDRRHLAHRLQRAGLGPVPVALLLLALGAPAVWSPGLPGGAATTGLFLVALVATRREAEPAPGLPPG